ncbi:DUF2474 domain-containing protein [Cupriavidus sp. WKF15]|nr:DUF2474 domain-containing protein [Cupriavidus sp. WKF15]WER49395.1 DUF2474 domain-containing protein [Cupriavidus sp. WKF15]
MLDRNSKRGSRWKQVLWLFGLWATGVATVGLAAELLRLVMQAVGFKSH